MNQLNNANVVLLHCDQLRYDGIGCMGNPFARTPNIDRLAADGTLFTRHIASNPICMPSRASLMTGLQVPGHNVWTNGVALNRKEYEDTDTRWSSVHGEIAPEPPTIADMFAAGGYDTVSYGKLHLTPYLAPKTRRYPESGAVLEESAMNDWHGPYYGFRHVELTHSHGEWTCHLGHYAAWFRKEHPDVYQEMVEGRKTRPRPVPELDDLYVSPLPLELHNSTWLANRFCDYIHNRREDDKPFFAFVGFPDPHHPFTPCRDVAGQFENIAVKAPFDPAGEGLKGSPGLRALADARPGFPKNGGNLVIQYTYAMVYQIDAAVGRIMEALRRAGLWDNTIIVFTSDHGDFLGDHGLLRKGFLASDALLHLPCIIRAPGSDLPERVNAPMSNCDLMPTLAALTGVQPPAWQHGIDIRSALDGETDHYALAFAFTGKPEVSNYTIYDSRHRLTWYPFSNYIELFDHENDPGECRNLGGAKGKKTLIKSLLRILQERAMVFNNPILGRVCAW